LEWSGSISKTAPFGHVQMNHCKASFFNFFIAAKRTLTSTG
jgi:hypothetical protein